MLHPKIQVTSDGSNTLFSEQIDETYHSVNGAIQESEHIFIRYALNECDKEEISILEIGFGTGLNAFLTLLEAEKNNKKITYTSLEKYPVSLEVAQTLNYSDLLDNSRHKDFLKMHQCDWDIPCQITDTFILQKKSTDFTQWKSADKYDIIYFDAFSPEKQPEMWSATMFRKLYDYANEKAILTTYCAKGVVRRAMQSVGFKVERLSGPPGKREVLRARK